MQLFSRRVHMVGPPAKTMEYAIDMRDYVTEKSGRDIALWSAMFGAPAGTLIYAVRVEGLADLQATTAKFVDDPVYHQKIAAGADYRSVPAEDSLQQPIHGELGDPPPVGAMAQITSAQIANGRYEEAFGWGVEMAQHAESVTGVPTMFLANHFGPFGSVTWIGVTADAAGVDAANQALWSDADYMKKLGAAGDLFVPGSGMQALAARVA